MTVNYASQIAALEAQKAAAESQKNSYPVGTPEYQNAENEYIAIQNKLSEVMHEAEQQQALLQAHEERVTQVVQTFNSALDSMDFGGLTLRQLCAGEEEYQLVSMGIKQAFEAQADKLSKQITEIEQSYAGQLRASDDRETQLQRQLNELQAKHTETEQQLATVTLELRDIENKRNAAVVAEEEARREVARLNSQVDDLRKEIAVGARAAIEVVDTEEEERRKKAAVEEIKKKRTIYGKEWVDPIKRDRFKAYRAATGEPIEFSWMEETKFFVIPEEEVTQFRQQYGTTAADNNSVQVPSVDQEPVQAGSGTVEVPQFPVIEAPQVPSVPVPVVEGLPGGDVQAEATGPVTREEFAALANRVAALEAGRVVA